MKQFLLAMLMLLCSAGISAAEFKVGDAKYEVLPNGTVELKEFKKASGDVVIPEKVTDPKTGTDYTVTAIGNGAFKKAPLTSVTIPSTVTKLGEQAFQGCANLSDVRSLGSVTSIPASCFQGTSSLKSFNFKNISNVADTAFTGSALGKIGVASIILAKDSQSVIYGITDGEGPTNLIIDSSIKTFYDIPIKSLPKKVKNIIFLNEEPTTLFVFTAIIRSIYGNEVGELMQKGVPTVKNGEFQLVDPATTNDKDKYNIPSVYLGATNTENGYEPVEKTAYSPYEVDQRIRTRDFHEKLQRFIQVAVEEPKSLSDEYKKIDPEETVKFNTELTNAIRVLCDSVYLVKPELSEAEIENVSGFINNFLMGIGADYGHANMQLEGWARADILNQDLQSGDHKDDYERILKSIDRYFTFKQPKADPYHQAMQLAALCGLERWKEAAAYFPKVHRAVTDNGKYYQVELPYEISYLQKAINNHGYKAVAPTYKKASAGSSDNGSAIEFFTRRAIELGVEHYKKKKAEKEFRELYYDAMGMDDKGRPRKSKK